MLKPDIGFRFLIVPEGAGAIINRTVIFIDRGQVRAFTRNGNDWTAANRLVVDACGKLACKAAVLDGEMVVQDEHGVSDFQALRSAIYTPPHRIIFIMLPQGL